MMLRHQAQEDEIVRQHREKILLRHCFRSWRLVRDFRSLLFNFSSSSFFPSSYFSSFPFTFSFSFVGKVLLGSDGTQSAKLLRTPNSAALLPRLDELRSRAAAAALGSRAESEKSLQEVRIGGKERKKEGRREQQRKNISTLSYIYV